MKRGFSLIELLSVVVILSVVSLLVFPNVVEIITQSKQNLYTVQVSDIELESKNWALENQDKIDKYHLNTTYLSLSTLKKEGFLEVDDLENPLTGKVMNGCIEIKYNSDTSQHTYKYHDETCNEYVTDEMHGIIYSYDSGDREVIEKNVLTSAGLYLVNHYQDNELMNSLGGTTDGLYDLGDTYIFRGTDPDNYLKIGTELYRILSIDKDYRMRIIKYGGLTTNWSDSTEYSSFLNSNVSTTLIEYLENENNSINSFKNKIVDGTTLHVGAVDNAALIKYNVLKSVEASNTISNKIGLMNLSDYVIASLEAECLNNYYANACADNNFLATFFGDAKIWTINPSKDANKAVIIENGLVRHYSVNGTNDITFKAYPVLYMDLNVSIVSGSGTVTKPYVLN